MSFLVALMIHKYPDYAASNFLSVNILTDKVQKKEKIIEMINNVDDNINYNYSTILRSVYLIFLPILTSVCISTIVMLRDKAIIPNLLVIILICVLLLLIPLISYLIHLFIEERKKKLYTGKLGDLTLKYLKI